MTHGHGMRKATAGIDPPVMRLDVAVLAALQSLDDDGSVCAEIVALFLSDTPPRLEAMREAASRGDTSVVRDGAHCLKGSAANLGACRMAWLCSEIETGELSRLDQLEREFEHVAAVLMPAAPVDVSTCSC